MFPLKLEYKIARNASPFSVWVEIPFNNQIETNIAKVYAAIRKPKTPCEEKHGLLFRLIVPLSTKTYQKAFTYTVFPVTRYMWERKMHRLARISLIALDILTTPIRLFFFYFRHSYLKNAPAEKDFKNKICGFPLSVKRGPCQAHEGSLNVSFSYEEKEENRQLYKLVLKKILQPDDTPPVCDKCPTNWKECAEQRKFESIDWASGIIIFPDGTGVNLAPR